MKEHLRDQKFPNDNEVMEAVQIWYKTIPKPFFLEDNCKLVDMWTKCLRNRGTMSKNKTQTNSISTHLKKNIKKFLLFSDLLSCLNLCLRFVSNKTYCRQIMTTRSVV